uniref:Uncharacterized protein n=1 Tax=Ciona intestinalis TaxID=7719 RepID=H2XPY9_CIOIN
MWQRLLVSRCQFPHVRLGQFQYLKVEFYLTKTPTSDFVNILKWETKRLVCWSLWWGNAVQGIEEGFASQSFLILFTAPPLVPRHVLGLLQHVVTVPTRNWDEGNSLGVVTDLLQISRHLLADFFETD